MEESGGEKRGGFYPGALCAGLVVADFYRVRRDGIDVGTYVLHPRSGTLSEG